MATDVDSFEIIKENSPTKVMMEQVGSPGKVHQLEVVEGFVSEEDPHPSGSDGGRQEVKLNITKCTICSTEYQTFESPKEPLNNLDGTASQDWKSNVFQTLCRAMELTSFYDEMLRVDKVDETMKSFNMCQSCLDFGWRLVTLLQSFDLVVQEIQDITLKFKAVMVGAAAEFGGKEDLNSKRTGDKDGLDCIENFKKLIIEGAQRELNTAAATISMAASRDTETQNETDFSSSTLGEACVLTKDDLFLSYGNAIASSEGILIGHDADTLSVLPDLDLSIQLLSDPYMGRNETEKYASPTKTAVTEESMDLLSPNTPVAPSYSPILPSRADSSHEESEDDLFEKVVRKENTSRKPASSAKLVLKKNASLGNKSKRKRKPWYKPKDKEGTKWHSRGPGRPPRAGSSHKSYGNPRERRTLKLNGKKNPVHRKAAPKVRSSSLHTVLSEACDFIRWPASKNGSICRSRKPLAFPKRENSLELPSCDHEGYVIMKQKGIQLKRVVIALERCDKTDLKEVVLSAERGQALRKPGHNDNARNRKRKRNEWLHEQDKSTKAIKVKPESYSLCLDRSSNGSSSSLDELSSYEDTVLITTHLSLCMLPSPSDTIQVNAVQGMLQEDAVEMGLELPLNDSEHSQDEMATEGVESNTEHLTYAYWVEEQPLEASGIIGTVETNVSPSPVCQTMNPSEETPECVEQTELTQSSNEFPDTKEQNLTFREQAKSNDDLIESCEEDKEHKPIESNDIIIIDDDIACSKTPLPEVKKSPSSETVRSGPEDDVAENVVKLMTMGYSDVKASTALEEVVSSPDEKDTVVTTAATVLEPVMPSPDEKNTAVTTSSIKAETPEDKIIPCTLAENLGSVRETKKAVVLKRVKRQVVNSGNPVRKSLRHKTCPEKKYQVHEDMPQHLSVLSQPVLQQVQSNIEPPQPPDRIPTDDFEIQPPKLEDIHRSQSKVITNRRRPPLLVRYDQS